MMRWGNGDFVLDLNIKKSKNCAGDSLSSAKVFRLLGALAFWSLCTLVAPIGHVHAQSTHYVYDANGRVVGVTANNNTSAQYSYNSLGHTSEIGAPLSSDQLAIFTFMPTHGEAGAQVTIYGQGFSAAAASDTVSFNGAVATVISATANQLVATVPSGVSTGPISVTANGQTATSATPFVIDDTGVPPSVIQVSPMLVSIGNTVTITGAHLDPVNGDTAVQMGNVDMLSVSSLTDSQLQYNVPSNAVSGFVAVETPYGEATSTTPVAVLPSSIVSQAGGLASTYLTVNGAPVNVSSGAVGQIGVLTFTARQGDNLELELSHVATPGGVQVQIYNPSGVQIQSYACNASTGPSCYQSLWNLGAGTYSVVVAPSGDGTIGFTAQVQSDVIGGALAVGTPVSVSLGMGQAERFTFQAAAGQAVALSLSNVSTTPAGQTLYMAVYAPGAVTPTNYYTAASTSSSTVLNLPNLSSGTYTVVVDTGGIGFPATAQLTLAAGVTGTLTSGSAGQSYGAAMPGQNAYLSFSANAGDNLELELSAVTTAANVQIYNASGVQVASYSCGAASGASCDQYLWNLAAGAYSVIVTPSGSGALAFTAQLQPDVMGPALTMGSLVSVNLGMGQVERFTFSATAGQALALNLSNVSTTPTGQTLTLVIYQPGAVTTTNYYTYIQTGGSTTLNLPNLPSTGVYTVVVDTGGIGFPATAQLTLGAGVAGTLTNNSASQSYTSTLPGENAYLSFTANAGDNLELELSAVNSAVQVQVYDPSGAQVASYSCAAASGASCDQYLWNLTAGTYSVIVTPSGSNTLAFAAQLQSDVVGPALTVGSSASVNLGIGQVERFTFSATAGQTLALDLSDVSTTPTNQTLTMVVYAPGAVTTTNYYTFTRTASSTVLNLPSLPSTGVYTVVVDTGGVGFPATAQLTLAAP